MSLSSAASSSLALQICVLVPIHILTSKVRLAAVEMYRRGIRQRCVSPVRAARLNRVVFTKSRRLVVMV
jgi:hypothetical protein